MLPTLPWRHSPEGPLAGETILWLEPGTACCCGAPPGSWAQALVPLARAEMAKRPDHVATINVLCKPQSEKSGLV